MSIVKVRKIEIMEEFQNCRDSKEASEIDRKGEKNRKVEQKNGEIF